MKCNNCKREFKIEELKRDEELWEDVCSDGIYVCYCCEEIEIDNELLD